MAGARDLIGGAFELIGSSKVTINSATTTTYDFGTPNDLDLRTALNVGDRLLVLFTATTAGTTDSVSFVVQDADDNAGSIGTPATAVTDGTLTGGTGDAYLATSVRIQPGRPWLRTKVTSDGATDTFVTTCQVYGVRRGLV